jgi:hypothetical protein
MGNWFLQANQHAHQLGNVYDTHLAMTYEYSVGWRRLLGLASADVVVVVVVAVDHHNNIGD